MKKILLSVLIFVVSSVAIAGVPRPASAAIAPGCDTSGSFLGLPTWYKYLDIGPKGNDKCAVIGPVDSNDRLDWTLAGPRIGLAIADIMIRLSGIITVAFIIYGGVQYVISEGDPEKAKKARGTIFNSLIGLVVVLVSTAIVTLIGNTLTK